MRTSQTSHARRLFPVSLSVCSLVPDLLFDCSRVLEFTQSTFCLSRVLACSPANPLLALGKPVEEAVPLTISIFRNHLVIFNFAYQSVPGWGGQFAELRSFEI